MCTRDNAQSFSHHLSHGIECRQLEGLEVSKVQFTGFISQNSIYLKNDKSQKSLNQDWYTFNKQHQTYHGLFKWQSNLSALWILICLQEYKKIPHHFDLLGVHSE